MFRFDSSMFTRPATLFLRAFLVFRYYSRAKIRTVHENTVKARVSDHCKIVRFAHCVLRFFGLNTGTYQIEFRKI
jgi:hypothetical protein